MTESIQSPSSADNYSEKRSSNTSETTSAQSSFNFEENTATHKPQENKKSTNQIFKQSTSKTNSIKTSISSIPTLKTELYHQITYQKKRKT